MSGWRLGIDIGGTFTDVIAVAASTAERRAAKVPSQPAEPVRAIIDAIAAVGLAWADVTEIVHGTTIVTNDIVEGKFAPCALVATSGFADTIEIGRMSRRHLYRLDLPPRMPALVPPELRFEIAARMAADGSEIQPLTEPDLERLATAVAASGADSVAVCLLHAWRNPAHERRVGQSLRQVVAHVCLSHEISPEFREFERMNTTALNAAMMRKIGQHLARIEAARPTTSQLHFMHSASGMASPSLIAERPLMLAMSGPAAGVTASCIVAQQTGGGDALTFDMGGTTTDVCLITRGAAEISANRTLGGRRIRLPMVAVDSIGAGGGSIARLVSGALVVGPESAGAVPGPACYGKGGTLPTVADADLLLGYLNPQRRLGGSVALSMEAARAAMEALAAEMAFSLIDAALGITRVVHAGMARALRRATIERGVDIRAFQLIAFGGAGPMHAAEVARLCGIRRVLIPLFSSGFSALGCVDATMTYSRQASLSLRSTDWAQDVLDARLAEQVAALSATLIEAGYPVDALHVSHVAGMRYSGQSYEIPIVEPALHNPAELARQFTDAHTALYGYATEEPWELAVVRTEVSAPSRSQAPTAWTPPLPAQSVTDMRDVTFERHGTLPTPVLQRASLPSGTQIAGPAVVEDDWSTVIVPPGDIVSVDGFGNLLMDVALS